MTVFIGDVHGWLGRLERLLAQIDDNEEIVFLGDLVDRGPDSAQVVSMVHELCSAGRARCVMGNHEFALVRGLGVPELNIPGDLDLLETWYAFYGGMETVESYGCELVVDDLREAMGEDLIWMAQLPWYLQGGNDDARWIATHSGLDKRPVATQLAELDDIHLWWQPDSALPAVLYAKDRISTLPDDLGNDTCVVSGHVPLVVPMVTRRRILCDTSGGRPDRLLTGVTWPKRSVIVS